MSEQNDNPGARPKCHSEKCPNVAVSACRGYCKKHYLAYRRAHRPVPAAVVVARVRQLRAAGYGYKRISQLSGLGVNTIRDLSVGMRKYTFADTAEKLFAIRIGEAVRGKTPALGVTRRLQAMVALGYTDVQLADFIGARQCNMWKYLNGSAIYVYPETFAKVDAAFLAVESQPMPQGWVAERARRRAARRGWAPPLAWDHDTIDDPNAQPGPFLRPVSNPRALPADWLEMVVERRELGRSDTAIAAEFGIDVDSLHRRFDRAGVSRELGREGLAS